MFSAIALPDTAEARYAAIVVDETSERVLFERNADTRNYPASLAKLMTLYLTFEALTAGELTLDQQVKVSRRAAGQSPSRLGLARGTTVSVEDAILALIVKSANDVATVLAERLGGTEAKFARIMTRKARSLGMTRTTFRNASGLPNRRQLSTARDIARLALALSRDFPQYYDYFARTSFRYQGREYRTHNNVLKSYPGAEGMKTGYIRASGFNLVTTAQRDGRRLVAVVFGGRSARSRDRHMRHLLDLGFTRVETGALGKLAKLNRIVPPRTYRLPRRFARVPLPPIKPERYAAAEIPRGGWSVQVGAYEKLASARRQLVRLAARLPDLLPHTAVKIDRIDQDSAPLYRARFLGLREPEAREACRRLERQDVSCIALPPAAASVEIAQTRQAG